MKKIIFRGKECYVCEGRLKNSQKINDFYYYDMRSGDEDMSQPVTIECDVIVNHFGLIACKEELTMEKEWAPGRFQIELTDKESMYIARMASEDRCWTDINETETVDYYAEEMEPDDEIDEEDEEFLEKYNEESEETLNEIDLNDANIEIEQDNNEE